VSVYYVISNSLRREESLQEWVSDDEFCSEGVELTDYLPRNLTRTYGASWRPTYVGVYYLILTTFRR